MYRADKINLLLPLQLVLLLWTPKISRIPEINLFNCYQDSGRENITLYMSCLNHTTFTHSVSSVKKAENGKHDKKGKG